MTAGFYTFRVCDLPEPFRAIPKVAANNLVTQFGESLADAQARTHKWLMEIDGHPEGEVEPITAAAVKFRSTIERKAKK